eukprot:EG_transcript_15810
MHRRWPLSIGACGWRARPALALRRKTDGEPKRSRTALRETDFEYCEDLVKKAEYEAWVLGKAFGEHQRAYYALYALQVELNYVWIKAESRDPQEKRFLFWKASVGQLFDGKVEATPVHRALYHVVTTYPVEKFLLRRMIDTRLKHVAVQQPRDVKHLGQYLDGTSGALLHLLLQVSGLKEHPQAEHAVGHLGKALGVVHLLRFTPIALGRRHTFFPMDICAKEGLSEEDLYRYTGDSPNEAVQRVVFQMAREAMGQLRHMRGIDGLPPAAYPTLLHTVLCETYLNRLQRFGFNVFDDRLGNQWASMAFAWNLMKRYTLHRGRP